MSESLKPEIAKALAGKKVAFISVFEKTGVDELAKALVKHGYALLSTGGTHKFLTEKGIPAIETEELTGFGELLGGRVKSLHPTIFAGILAEAKDRPDVPVAIDTVVVSLYPFETERKNQGDVRDADHLLHFIDIGGSALIRAAAKNHPLVNIVCDAAQYPAFIAALDAGKGETTLPYRRHLAVTAFEKSAYYDSLIARTLTDATHGEDPAWLSEEFVRHPLPETISLPLAKIQDLRYGENPHQVAGLYGLGKREVDFEALHGKELSYNNILDMEAAWRIATEFTEETACVIVKHNNPCGVAIGRNPADAFKRALDTDPLSAFGGVVAFNKPVDEVTAALMKDIFLEVIVAPDILPEAFQVLSAKKNLRLVRRELPQPNLGVEYKQVSPELFLLQGLDPRKGGNMTIVTETKPSEEQLDDMAFAWKVVKHVKSNAIVLVKDGKTVGIGGGQTSRIGALENALKLACEQATDCIMASDGFLPHEDNIYAAAHARVGAIIQPGGSVKDEAVIALSNQYKIPMVTTGIREFRH